jgi:hypothetical protein
MKVYVLLAEMEYEYTNIVAVYETRQLAEDEMLKRRAGDSYHEYSIQECEVISA